MAENIELDGYTYEGVESVALTDTDGNTVIYGSVKSVAGVAYDPATGDVPLTSDALGIEPAEAVQSDWNSLDMSGPDFVKGRTHYDNRMSLTWEIGSAGTETVIYSDMTLEKISDTAIVGSGIDFWQEDHLSSVPSLLLTASDGTSYSLNLNVSNSLIISALAQNQGYNSNRYHYGYYTPYSADTGSQTRIDKAVDFNIWLVVSPKGSSLEHNEDGSAKTLNEGTYITYEAMSSGIESGTITISAGEILRLDKKYLPSDVVYNTEFTSQISKLEAKIPNMANYYTKKQVDAKIPSMEGYYTRDEVAKQIAAILPEFSAADEGKVLGIQNGVLAWVTAAAAQPDDGSGEDSNTSTAYIDGTTLVVDGTVDGTTLAVNGTVDNGTLRFSGGTAADSTVDGGTLAVSGAVTDGTLSISGTVDNTTLIL